MKALLDKKGMTGKQIEARMKAEQEKTRIVYETAAQICLILEQARKAYGAEAWDEDDAQTKILDLVTEEE